MNLFGDSARPALLQASGYDMAGTPEDVTEEYQADFALDGAMSPRTASPGYGSCSTA